MPDSLYSTDWSTERCRCQRTETMARMQNMSIFSSDKALLWCHITDSEPHRHIKILSAHPPLCGSTGQISAYHCTVMTNYHMWLCFWDCQQGRNSVPWSVTTSCWRSWPPFLKNTNKLKGLEHIQIHTDCTRRVFLFYPQSQLCDWTSTPPTLSSSFPERYTTMFLYFHHFHSIFTVQSTNRLPLILATYDWSVFLCLSASSKFPLCFPLCS